MTLENDIPGFGGANVRSDRLQVVRRPNGFWSVVPHAADQAQIDDCPCCDKPLLSSRAAKLIANIVYPLAS